MKEEIYQIIIIFGITSLSALLCGTYVLYLFKEDVKYNDIKFFEEAISKFKENHNYTAHVYDCDNYTNDFYDIMVNFGYDIRVKSGERIKNNKTIAHAWNQICFDIDATRGTFFNNDKIYYLEKNEYYKYWNETRKLGN